MVPIEKFAVDAAKALGDSLRVHGRWMACVWLALCLLGAGTVSSVAEPDGFRAVAAQPAEDADGAARDDGIRTVDINMGESSFDVSSIAVEPGETVRFVLNNTSAVPHDFTIGTPEKQRIRRRYISRIITPSTRTIPPADRDKLDSWNSVVLRPGETRQLVWTFDITENVEFASNAAGNYEAGMKGRFVVPSAGNHGQDPASVDTEAGHQVVSAQAPADDEEQTAEPVHASLPHHIRLSAIREQARSVQPRARAWPKASKARRKSKHGLSVRTNFNGRANRGSLVNTRDVGAVDRGGKPRRPDLRPSILPAGGAD